MFDLSRKISSLHTSNYEGSRVETPWIPIDHETLKLTAAPHGGKPVETAITLGERPDAPGLTDSFKIYVSAHGQKLPQREYGDGADHDVGISEGRAAAVAPPRTEAVFASRAGDARSPYALSQALYHRDPQVADIVFEGGDLAATPRWIFADANLVARNVGRGAADRASIEAELHRRFGQELVWLGAAAVDVPRHHIMMYAVPLDDQTVAVGDVRAGVALLGASRLLLDDVAVQARRFDHAAELLAARGFRIVRVPASCWPAPARSSRTPTRCSIGAPTARASSTCRPTRSPRSMRPPGRSTRRRASTSGRSTCRRSIT